MSEVELTAHKFVKLWTVAHELFGDQASIDVVDDMMATSARRVFLSARIFGERAGWTAYEYWEAPKWLRRLLSPLFYKVRREFSFWSMYPDFHPSLPDERTIPWVREDTV